MSDEEMEFFVDHASLCSSCRRAYEAELAIKSTVQRHVKMVRTPRAVVEGIQARIAAEECRMRGLPAPVVQAPRTRRLRSLLTPATAVIILCGLVLLLINRVSAPAPGGSSNNDVILQSLSQYHALLSGQRIPEIPPGQPDNLLQFFSGKTEFPVVIPALRGFELVGASLSTLGGARCVHLVYRHDDRLLSVSQVCWQTVIKGETLDVPPHVKRELLRSGWFANTDADGESVLLWTTGNTLCAAVSRMAAGDLRDRLAFDSDPSTRVAR